MIPYGKQDINQDDIDAVISVLKSDWLTQGPAVPIFEKAVAAKCQSGYAVAVTNATAALHLACRALGLGIGDLLWTTPITFVASANCALYCGAEVDFVDIDPATYNMSVAALEEKLIAAKKLNRLPRIVIPVHLAGQSCQMREIKQLSEQYGFAVIEDASHAIGGSYHDNPVGNCKYSDVTVFSFHPVKIITTGEGGMALTNNQQLANKMSLLRSHGITKDLTDTQLQLNGDWYYAQLELGYNYRMTDIQAALGASQLSRIDDFIQARRDIVERYNKILPDKLTLPQQIPESNSAWHLYVVRVAQETNQKNRREVFDYLRKKGIGVNVHYIPVHTQPYYQQLGFKLGDYPAAEKYYSEAITLPLHPQLTLKEQDYIADCLAEILG